MTVKVPSLCVVALAASCGGDGITSAPLGSIPEFEQRLEDLRANAHISAFEANMARGYTFTLGGYNPTAYPTYFGAAAGLTSSALDVAAFSMAMDRDALLQPATKALAYTPAVSPSGQTFPYGLGWFSTDYQGVRIIWHYGLWTANSSLIIKVPERGLTFVVLADTDGLSVAYPLGQGKLETSPWARAFLDTFVIGSVPLPATL